MNKDLETSLSADRQVRDDEQKKSAPYDALIRGEMRTNYFL